MKKTCIEIGACDFDNLDGFLSQGRVIFVEPVLPYLESLKKKIVHPNAVFENCAITSFNGEVTMKYIEPSTVKDWWVKGISHVNFSSSNLIEKNQQMGNDLGEIQTAVVPAMTLDSFLDKHKVTDIEVLKVDVEGHELELFKYYSWKVKPRRIKVEHKHSSRIALEKLLLDNGYNTITIGDDIYGIINYD